MSKGDDNLFSIKQTTKGKLPRLPFALMKDTCLGNNYELSLVFAGDTLTKRLNITYREKNKPANVLSFPLSKNSGEIFINLKRAKIEAAKRDESFDSFVGFLFIHGMLHLKGYDHGSKMERAENTLRKKFGV